MGAGLRSSLPPSTAAAAGAELGVERQVHQRAAWLAAALVFGLHLVLVNHFLPLGSVFTHKLIQGGDYDTHIGQTFRVIEGLRGWGRPWVYDVKLLAGQPEGVIFDADNKGWELFTYVLSKLGVNEAVAFNSFVWCAMLCCPLIVLVSARLFGLGAGGAVLAAAMASTLWFFDSFCHWQWWIGMVAYALASYLALLPLALFNRFVETGAFWAAAASALANGIAHLIHPYTFFILAVPMLALFVRGMRHSPRTTGLAALGLVSVTIAINLYWLLPAFAHWHYILNSAYFCDTGFDHLISDFFDLLRDPDDSGVIGTRAGFRFFYLGLALCWLGTAYARRDRRLLVFGSSLAALFVLGYLGSHVPGGLQIQPYRHVLPLAFAAVIPAAAFCEQLWVTHAFAQLAAPLKALLAASAIFTFQHLGIEALYFLPKIVPDARRIAHDQASPISKYGFLAAPEVTHVFYGLPVEPWIENYPDEVAAWVEKNLPPGARVLAETTALGERLAWQTHVEVIGGFLERNLEHAQGNFFRHYEHRDIESTELANYLRSFNIGWVITQNRRDDLERAAILEQLPPIRGWSVYRTRIPLSPFLSGSGSLQASTNTIQVAGTNPRQLLVLSYHWHESLRCTPGCRVERQPIKYDGVGFIRIPSPHPASFAIFNSYK
jgi:hypothetical protein